MLINVNLGVHKSDAYSKYFYQVTVKDAAFLTSIFSLYKRFQEFSGRLRYFLILQLCHTQTETPCSIIWKVFRLGVLDGFVSENFALCLFNSCHGGVGGG